MITGYNPSVRQELRYENPAVTPVKAQESTLAWLKRTGRLKTRENEPVYPNVIAEEIEEIIDLETYPVEEEE